MLNKGSDGDHSTDGGDTTYNARNNCTDVPIPPQVSL